MRIDKLTAQRIVYLQPYMHLIEAIAEGKTVQVKARGAGTAAWVAQDGFAFNEPPEDYRIKPIIVTLTTRRILRKIFGSYTVDVVHQKDYIKDPYLYTGDTFVKWLDDDWLATEVE